jgi:hypothetical protein
MIILGAIVAVTLARLGAGVMRIFTHAVRHWWDEQPKG